MRHEIPEEPARRGSHICVIICLDGPAENMDASTLARKTHAGEIHKKAGSISNTFELPWPVRGDMKKRLPTKRCGGEPPPYAALNYPDARHYDFHPRFLRLLTFHEKIFQIRRYDLFL